MADPKQKNMINLSNFTPQQLKYLTNAARTSRVLDLQAQFRDPNPVTRRAKYLNNYKKQQVNPVWNLTQRKRSRKHRKTYRK
jgi:penicillin-binding protein-related factor A (putative recombinase)